MSDTAFKAAAYPGVTTARLQELYASYSAIPGYGATAEKMDAELIRRAARDVGDVSVMTEGERLRFLRTGKA